MDVAANAVAQRHLNWLNSPDDFGESQAFSHPHLFRNVADQLLELGLHNSSRKFYETLKLNPEETDASLEIQIGRCFALEERHQDAEEHFRAALQLDEDHIQARVELARIYEKMDEPEQAFAYSNEVMALKNLQNPKRVRKRRKAGHAKPPGQSFVPNGTANSGYKSKSRAVGDRNEELLDTEELQLQYYNFRRERDRMRDGNESSTELWISAARDLTDDFRSCKAFYPYDSQTRFLGYTGISRIQAELRLDMDLSTVTNRTSPRLFTLFLILRLR